MPRGFLAGLMLGAVAGGAGLGLLSLVAPLPQPAASEAGDPSQENPAAAAAVPQPEVEAPLAEAGAAPAAVAPAEPEPAADLAVIPAPDAATEPETVVPPQEPAPEALQDLVPETPEPPAGLTVPPPAAPGLPAPSGEAAPTAPVPPLAAPEAPAQPEAGAEAPGPDSAAETAAGTLPGPVVLDVPALPPAGQAELPSEEPADAPQELSEQTPQEAPSEGQASAAPRLIQPNSGLAPDIEGVRQDRLPRIGDAPASEEAPADLLPVVDALKHYSRSFANPLARPPFAVLLLDDGSMDEADLEGLAGSPMPLTLVIDPSRADAADRAALWRSAGQEVALLARDIPAAAQPADGEVAVEAMTRAVPEALALVVPPGGGALQSDRISAASVMPALHSRGFGLVTWDQGLNAGDQVARREGLPAVTIYRDLNGNDETGPVIGRYLDRAAFKAQQDGRAVVFGRLDGVTAATLLEWSLSARAASLALAPLSVVLN